MAVFYLDLVNGNDTNDGTSFTNRWKTFANGASAARIAPGDVIRVMKSPDPIETAVQATWTNGSNNIVLDTPVTLNVEMCQSAWTASANVTASTSTVSPREGTANIQLAIAAAFTIGKVAYKQLPLADFSSMQQVSFWFKSTVSHLYGAFSLNLCSDNAGAVPVNSLSFPAYIQANTWQCITIDNGASLGSNIQSIALVANNDPGAVTISLDCVIACKNPSSVDAITLDSLIGKNTTGETWYSIRSINGSVVSLDCGGRPTNVPTFGYSGTTEQIVLWRRETIKLPTNNVSACRIMDSGTAGNLITFECGYDELSMSSITGETWIDGQNFSNSGVAKAAGDATIQNYVALSNIAAVRYSTGFELGYLQYSRFDLVAGNNNASIGVNVGTKSLFNMVTAEAAVNNGYGGLTVVGFKNQVDFVTVSGNYGLGVNVTGGDNIVAVVDVMNNGGLNAVGIVGHRTVFEFERIKNNGNTGGTYCLGISGSDVMVTGGDIDNPLFPYAISLSGSHNRLYGISTDNHLTAAVAGLVGTNYAYGCSFNETVKFATPLANYNGSTLYVQTKDNVAGDAALYSEFGYAYTQQAVRHTAAGHAWVLSAPTASQMFPFSLELGKVPVVANVQRTVSVWAQRSDVNTVGILRCRGGELSGVVTNQDAVVSGVGSFEQLTIQFTPIEDGLATLEFLTYGPGDVFVDDLSVN